MAWVALAKAVAPSETDQQLADALRTHSETEVRQALLKGANPKKVYWFSVFANSKLLRLILLADANPNVTYEGYSYAHSLVDQFEMTGNPWSYGCGRQVSGPGSRLTRPPDAEFIKCLEMYKLAGGRFDHRLKADHPMGYGRIGWTPLDMAKQYAYSSTTDMKPMLEALERLSK